MVNFITIIYNCIEIIVFDDYCSFIMNYTTLNRHLFLEFLFYVKCARKNLKNVE